MKNGMFILLMSFLKKSLKFSVKTKIHLKNFLKIFGGAIWAFIRKHN